MAATENKGKIVFSKDDNAWGYVKGKAKWAKVLKPDDYGNFGVDLYVDEENKQEYIDIVKGVVDTAYDGVVGLGKKTIKQDEYLKVDKDGNEFIRFKLEGDNKFSEEPNKINIYDVYGKEVKDWDKLIGNDSIIKVKFRAKPYFMSSSKVSGASVRFFAIQVIDLKEYSGGGNSGFGDETTPFDTESSEF